MTKFSGALMRARREQLGLSREELAVVTGRSHATVTKLERDEICPSMTTLERLCDALEYPVQRFFAGDPADHSMDERPTDLGRDVDEWIRKTLASAPPLTDRQARRISEILFGRSAPEVPEQRDRLPPPSPPAVVPHERRSPPRIRGGDKDGAGRVHI